MQPIGNVAPISSLVNLAKAIKERFEEDKKEKDKEENDKEDNDN